MKSKIIFSCKCKNIKKAILTNLGQTYFARINCIKEFAQSPKIRLFSIRRSNGVYKHTVGICELFLLSLLSILNLILMIVCQTCVSLFYSHEFL